MLSTCRRSSQLQIRVMRKMTVDFLEFCTFRQPEEAPHLSCGISMLPGAVTKPDICEANKPLRFAETLKIVTLTFPRRHGCRCYDLGAQWRTRGGWFHGSFCRSCNLPCSAGMEVFETESYFPVKCERRNPDRSNSCGRGAVCEGTPESDSKPCGSSVWNPQ